MTDKSRLPPLPEGWLLKRIERGQRLGHPHDRVDGRYEMWVKWRWILMHARRGMVDLPENWLDHREWIVLSSWLLGNQPAKSLVGYLGISTARINQIRHRAVENLWRQRFWASRRGGTTVPPSQWPIVPPWTPAKDPRYDGMINYILERRPPPGERSAFLETLMKIIADCIYENAEGDAKLALEGLNSLVRIAGRGQLLTRKVEDMTAPTMPPEATP